MIKFSHGDKNSRGVCILFRKGVPITINKTIADINGRFLICEILCSGELLCTLAVIYGPNNDNPAFFDGLSQNLWECNSNLILVGDFNLVMNPQIDRHKSLINHEKAHQKLTELISDHNLTDVWRDRSPGIRRYSWSRHTPALSASRIDYALVSRCMDTIVENITYTTGVMSDHSALFMSVKEINHERGPGFWKMNASLLQRPEVIKQLKQHVIKEVDSSASPLKKWERIKKAITTTMKEISRNNCFNGQTSDSTTL